MLVALYRFCLNALSEHLIRATAVALLLALGFGAVLTPEYWGAEPPAWYNWWIGPAFFLVATLVLAAIFEKYSLELRDAPEALRRLRNQNHVTFLEVIDTIYSAIPDYSKDDILHRLLRALWRGEFESRCGKSRLTLIGGHPIRYVGGEASPVDRDSNDVAVSPQRYSWNRRKLLITELGVHEFYGTLTNLKPQIKNANIPWQKLRKQINFPLLASIKPGNYDSIYLEAYIKPLAMSQRDFRRWFKRLRRGNYEE